MQPTGFLATGWFAVGRTSAGHQYGPGEEFVVGQRFGLTCTSARGMKVSRTRRPTTATRAAHRATDIRRRRGSTSIKAKGREPTRIGIEIA
jgi:hypothetical protein